MEPIHHGGTREIALKNGSTARGIGVFRNRQVQHESGLEQRVCKILQSRHDVRHLRSQYPKVDYVGSDGKSHHHTFDYWIELTDGWRVAVAVKQEKKRKEMNEVLDRILAKGSPLFDDAILMTEKYANWDAYANAADIVWSREHHDAVEVNKLMGELKGRSTVQFYQLLTQQEFKTRNIAIWRLIEMGHLKAKRPGRITQTSWFNVNL